MTLLPWKFNIIPLLNPFIRCKISSFSESGTNKYITRDTPIIVSLTSYGERFNDLPVTIYSLLNQSMRPDRVILWLDEDLYDMSILPYEITKFVKNGLEIRFVKDIKSYTKGIYAFKEFSEAIIVTADDDIYYRKDWLKRLYHSYIANQQDIHVHRAHRVAVKNGKILPYEKWKKHVKEETSLYSNFLTGVGGVLYPPNCFSKEVIREDIFLKCCPDADDIWLWVMAVVNGRKIRVVKNHYKRLIMVNFFRHFRGRTLYSKNKNGGNDRQLDNLMKLYGLNIMSKLREDNE